LLHIFTNSPLGIDPSGDGTFMAIEYAPYEYFFMNIFFRFLSCIILTSTFISNLALAEPESVNLEPMPADLEME
jgi:hypothetical protein